MRIDWSTLILQTVNALVLVWLLARFLFKPVANIIAGRQEAARTLLADAQAAKSDAQRERDAAQQERTALDAAHADAIRTIDAQAAAEKDALLQAAQAELTQKRTAAQAELERDRAAQLRAVQADAVDLAADIAAKLLARLPRDAKIAGFVDGLAGAFAALPAASRDELTAAGAPLTLRAPCALTDAETAAIDAALAQAAGRPVRVAVVVDPALIAGLELRAPHGVVSNHFRRDLDEIRTSLADTHEDRTDAHA